MAGTKAMVALVSFQLLSLDWRVYLIQAKADSSAVALIAAAGAGVGLEEKWQ